MRLLVCMGVVLLAGLVRLWPLDFMGDRLPYTTFYPAIMIAAVYGGFNIALLAIILASTIVLYFPFYPTFIKDSTDWLGLAIFMVNGVLFAIVGAITQRTYRRMLSAISLSYQLAAALDNISAFIYVKDKNSRYVYANRKTLELFKCTLKELKGADDYQFFPKETAQKLLQVDARVLKGESTAEEFLNRVQGEEDAIYWDVKSPIYEHNSDKVWGLCGIATDITSRKQREDALRESEERFRSVFDSAAIGMALVSLEGRFVKPNKALCRILGYSEEELSQKKFQDITHPDDLKLDLDLVQELLSRKRLTYQIEKRYFHKNGQIIWILLSAAVVHDAEKNIKYFIAQIIDITERMELLSQLEQQAHQDYLTGLYNRRFFISQGEREVSLAQRFKQPLTLLMLDIDHFKLVNDTYGHKIGDIVLKNLSILLKNKLRAIDIIGRLGGEEFAIILPKTSLIEARYTAERLREYIIETPVKIDNKAISYTISIGIAVLNDQDSTIDQLLSKADSALYQAKREGRNKVCAA